MYSERLFYPSQFEYENGRTMCTCASVLWSVAVLENKIDALTNQKNMQQVMQAATALFVKAKNKDPENVFFQAEEVVKHLQLPRVLNVSLHSGCWNPTEEWSNIVLDFNKFQTYVAIGRCCIMTSDRLGTTAIFRGSKSTFFFFDPHVACITMTTSEEQFADCLKDITGIHETSLTFLW
jgi:hypothetical protein